MRVIATTEQQMLVYCACENITAQRQAENNEREAKESELAAKERLQLVLQNIDSAVQATVFEDSGARVIFANDKYYEQLGYTREQYEHDRPDPFSFIHPQDREHAIEVSTQNNATRTPYSLTYRLIRRDGSLLWRQSRISFIDFPGERLPVQLSVASDITSLKESEQQNATVTGQLQAVMDNVGCGITAIIYNDDALEYLMINDRYYEMLGYTKEEYHQLKDFSPICEEDRQRTIDISRKVYASGGTANVECRANKADGSLIWLRYSLTMTRFAGVDKPVQLAIFSDVTTERTATQELMDNLPGGAALYEYDGETLVPVYINKRYWELVGRSPIDYAGNSVISAVHPDDKPMVLKAFRDAMQTGRGVSIDLRARYGKDEYRMLHFDGRLIRKSNGKFAVYASYSTVSDEELTIRETLPIALAAVMSASTDISFVKGKDLKYISCSRGFATLAGFACADDLVGKDSSAVFPADLASMNEEADRMVLQTGESIVDANLLFPTKGGMRHLLFSKYPLMDAKGNILGVYGNGRDETESRRVKSQLEILANSIPGGIAIYEGLPDGLDQIKLTYFSDGFCRLFGYAREEYERLAAVNPLGLVSSGDLSGMYDSVLKLVREGVPMDYVYRAKINGGGHKWINVQALMGEPNGNKLTVNAVFLDVSEQKNAMERLRMSEEERLLAIQHSDRVVCRYEVAKRRLTVLHNADPKFGSTDVYENIPDASVQNGSISPETAEGYLAFFHSILSGTKSGSVAFQRMSQTGWRWMEGQFTAIFSSDHEPSIAIITFNDITDKRERDAAYHRWQQSLREKNPVNYSVYRCNISRNAPYDANSGELLSIAFKDGEWTFDERTIEYAEQFVHEEDRDAYIAFLRSDTLLSAYYAGSRSSKMDYREKLPDGGYRWLRVTADTTEYENSSDVEVYLLYENIDSSKRAELLMREQAQTDPLTGIFNRNTFAEKMEKIIANSSPSTQHALLMLDVDEFKQVNDVHGHAVGDRVLIEIAELLQSSLRRNDLLCRLGGDEFMILLSDVTDNAAVENKAQKICELVHSASKPQMSVSCSLGMVVFTRAGADLDALYRKADIALYHVKASGKDGFAHYHDEMKAAEKFDGVSGMVSEKNWQ